MKVLMTGGSGFVGSALISNLLAMDEDIHVTSMDTSPPSDLLLRLLGSNASRLRSVEADVRNADAVRGSLAGRQIDALVHAATVTHSPDVELHEPARYVDVNLGGTVAVLEAMRASSSPPRLLYLSSGAVYGNDPHPVSPRPEDTPLRPVDTYGISKLAAEQMVGRYTELFGLDTLLLRPSKVFGAMERPTSSRTLMSAPYHLAAAVNRGRPLRVTSRTLDASADWIGVNDLSHALLSLLGDWAGRGQTFNVSSGRLAHFTELAKIAERQCGWDPVEVATQADAELDIDPAAHSGKDDAYANAALTRTTGWHPRPLREQVVEYLTWAERNPEIFSGPAQVPTS